MAKINASRKQNFNFSLKILQWYDRHGRALPWRENNGRAPSPYHTWLSEIMLQQTGVATVIDYYQRFVARWPTVQALAQASEDEVLKAWEGLGYYSRARNLLRCARVITTEYNGIFPCDISLLIKLPGIGPYTANAIAAIAFDVPAVVVDGNVERVMARLHGYSKPINTPQGKKDLTAMAAHLAPVKRSGDYAQALMDLGATVCTPQNPACGQCPWQGPCIAATKGKTKEIPVKTAAKKIPTRYAVAYIVRDSGGRILLQQRPAKGLLGGLWEFPGPVWRETKWTKKEIEQNNPFPRQAVQFHTRPVLHVFSHFKLSVSVVVVAPLSKPVAKGQWFLPEQLPAMATLHRKVLRAALGDTQK